jgi:hypothetical protein
MCNIENRSIPAVQLTQPRKRSNKNFQGTGVLKSSQSCQVLPCNVAASQWRCLAEIVSFSGSCRRCLVLSPLQRPTLPKLLQLVCGHCFKGMSVVQGAVPGSSTGTKIMQSGVWLVCTPAERASKRIQPLPQHHPLETNTNAAEVTCKRWRRCPVRGRCVEPWQAKYFKVREQPQTCTLQTIVPPPRILLSSLWCVH